MMVEKMSWIYQTPSRLVKRNLNEFGLRLSLAVRMRRLRFWVFQIGAEDDEAVFDAFVQRGNFGVAQADVVGEEDFRHVGEQERAVDGGDFDGVPVGVVFFGGYGDARRNRHVAAAAADAAAVALGFGNSVSVNKAVEGCG